jgi:TRAP-type C4-dicarboxylate transport system permease small subunit
VAWIEREPPALFWTLLGLAAVTALAGMAATLAANLALATSPELFAPMAYLGEALGVVGAILTFVALARLTPAPPEPATGATLTAGVLEGSSQSA